MADLLDAFTGGLQAALGYQAIFFALLAIGLNVHFGYTGLLNFGQIAFAMLGGFGIAISVVRVGAAVLGRRPRRASPPRSCWPCCSGFPTLRLRADYLAIVTIAAAEVLRLVFRSVWATPGHRRHPGPRPASTPASWRWRPWAGGRQYDILGTRWSGGELWVALVGWTLVVLCCLLVWALMRSPWGRVLGPIREDEDAARALGKNVYSYKMQALVLGGVFGALGGMVYAVGTGSVNPDQYQNANTFLAYAALILGGAAACWGRSSARCSCCSSSRSPTPCSRALISNGIIPRDPAPPTDVAQLRFVLIGVGLMLLLVFRPQGIFGDRREVMLDAR